MPEFRWAVDTITGEFLYGGSSPYDVMPGLSNNQTRVVLDRSPNPRTEKYSGNLLSPFLLKTSEEIAAYDTTQIVTGIISRYNVDKNLQATALWILQRLLGRAPTNQEKLTAKNEWLVIRQSLGL